MSLRSSCYIREPMTEGGPGSGKKGHHTYTPKQLAQKSGHPNAVHGSDLERTRQENEYEQKYKSNWKKDPKNIAAHKKLMVKYGLKPIGK